MGYNNGTYTRNHNFSADASANIKIIASRHDTEWDDLTSALSNVVWTRDGNTVPTANIPMGGRRHINVAAAVSVNNYMRVREFIENVPIFMQDQESSADRISVSAQYFTSVSANQAPVDGTRILVRAGSDKASAVMYLNGHSANVEFQDGNRAVNALVSGGVYEMIFSSADAVWKVTNPNDGRTAAERAASVTPTNYQYEPGDVRRYGAVGDGTTDDSTAIANWLKVGAQGVGLSMPPGTYSAASHTAFTTSGTIRINGPGRGLATITGPGNSSSSDSFITTTGSVYIDGVTFDSFFWVVGIGALTVETDIEVTNCGFTDNTYAVYRSDAVVNTVGVGGVLIQGNVVDASGISGSRGFWIQGRYRDVRIIGNKVENVSSRPITIGHNDYDDQDQMVRAVVMGNTVRNITGALTDETQGILVYGRNAAIIGNVLEDITSAASSACEGIYTKCRFATIVGNTLYDAGDNEAAITIKGSKRGETSSPQGYSVVCANNNIFFSTNSVAYGITIQQEDVLVEGNHIEGAGLYGIYTTDLVLNNVTIRNNRIIKCTGERGISIHHNGTGTNIVGNEIIELDSRNTFTNGFGIFVDPQTSPGLVDIDVSGNVVRIDGDSAATGSVRGITLLRTQAINGARINRNRISVTHTVTTYGITLAGTGGGTNWEIQDNDISTDENPFAVTGGELPAGLDFRHSWRYQTTAAGPASAMAFTLADEASYSFGFRAVAVLNDGAEQNMYHREALYFRNGGGATIVGTVQDIGTPQEITAAWNATFGVSTNDVQVQLTGEASHTINWRLWIHVLGVSAA